MSLEDALSRIVGSENLLIDPAELLVYEADALVTHRAVPRAVVFVSSTLEVSRVVSCLKERGVPFVARGAGTGLSGGALALQGSVVIEMSRMQRILSIDYTDRIAVVEAGLININLSKAVESAGFFYAPDPSSQTACTIGGNIAENAGGPHCLKYGSTVNHILGLKVVLPDSSIVDLENSFGYDLTGLFVGSEGTLGIATEAKLRLTPLPEAVRTCLVDFPTTTSASRAVSSIIAAAVLPAALEMMDRVTINAIEDSVYAAGLPRDAAAVLIVELDGLEVEVTEQAEQVRKICLAEGARTVKMASSAQERAQMWAGRKGAFGAMGRISPDLMVQDAVIPRSRLPEVLEEIYSIADRYRLKISNVFHAGDGNLHPNISYDGRDPDEVARVKSACNEIMRLCVSVGGSISGEHGVGVDKLNYMPLIFSEDDLRIMACIRACFNPDGLANPGKTIPALRCRAY